jgi:outer membrane protein, heavy metal efflux system
MEQERLAQTSPFFSAELPVPPATAGLEEFLVFGTLQHPGVQAAYHQWAASVHRITVERSLPDPRLTFETDIRRIVMSLMPGLMIDLPGPGKLGWMAAAATAESQALYHQFESALLAAAYQIKRAYYQLHFLEASIRINGEAQALLSEIEEIARAQNAAGRSTLQDVLRAQIEQERLANTIANLEDSRSLLLARWKAALGLSEVAASAPIPAAFESSVFNPSDLNPLEIALARNPAVRAMEAEVRQAEAALRLAERGRVPDFSLGVMADVKAAPVMWRPQASMTLPVWRDKIAAQIAAGLAEKSAAEARLNRERIMLAVEVAEKSFMLRESTRDADLLRVRLLPLAHQAYAVARSGYLAGLVDFLNLLEAERTLLELRLSEVTARTQQELAAAELSILILNRHPVSHLLPPADELP